MLKKQVKLFQKKLIDERDKLLEKLNFDRDSFGDLKKNEVGDLVDKAFTMWEKDRAIDISENDKKTMREIQGALQRIHTGQFGHCQICGSTIDEKRLEALPWAQQCVDPKKCPNRKPSGK
jgi:DnaK suppressor protein